MTAAAPLLDVAGLRVEFQTEDGPVHAVDEVSFSVEPGETLGIVGESGSGKSVTALTVLGLTRADNARSAGSAHFEGADLLQMGSRDLQKIRGAEISMIFQDPLSSLHPFFTVGDQLVEGVRAHRNVSKREARDRASEFLGLVGIPDPSRRLDDYPHEFSGGMRQRAMIAMALVNEPKLLIADEPTTALDVTTQAQILALLKRLKDELGMALIMITHDLGVVAEVADRVLVMYAGRVVEEAGVDDLFHDPQHPYTWGLLGSLTRLDTIRSPRLSQIAGAPPSLLSPPQGCHFRPRCPHEFEQCPQVPGLDQRGGSNGHRDRCWLDAETKRTRRLVDGRIALNPVEETQPAGGPEA
jgi:peptide/nickel transport system ATP-binding protein/oligopeptide transport system ATP-binding protein